MQGGAAASAHDGPGTFVTPRDPSFVDESVAHEAREASLAIGRGPARGCACAQSSVELSQPAFGS